MPATCYLRIRDAAESIWDTNAVGSGGGIRFRPLASMLVVTT